jgi:hypothetical protein
VTPTGPRPLPAPARVVTLCERCGHMSHEHRRPRWLWALIGRRACTHRYTFGTHRRMSTVWCACDGIKLPKAPEP